MSASFSENFTPIFRVWRLPIIALVGAWLILCAGRIPPGWACLWAALIGLTVVYPTARFARTRGDAPASVYAMAAVCCLGGLAVLWALGAPRAALLLLVCGMPGALLGLALSRRGWGVPLDVALLVFVGGVLFMASWWGLGVLALGLYASCSHEHGRGAVIAAWVIGLGMAWVVYVPVLSLWSLLGFFWGFVGWLGG